MAIIFNLTVGTPGSPADGDTNFFNPSLAGRPVKVLREGLYQYRAGSNFILVPGGGTIVFFPAMWGGERIRIQAY